MGSNPSRGTNLKEEIMIARNDVTGDELKTGVNNDSYRDGWERIFGKNQEAKENVPEQDTKENKPE